MTGAREPETHPLPDGTAAVAPAEPADWVKPVELIELLQRRSAKRKQTILRDAPTSSPFYDADFVAKHRRKGRLD